MCPRPTWRGPSELIAGERKLAGAREVRHVFAAGGATAPRLSFAWFKNLWSRWFISPDAGQHGERLAAAYLRRQCGHEILVRNWRNPADEREEIDLITRDGSILVFVEVKARAAGALVPGYYAVTARKKRVLRRACLAYLKRLRQRPHTFRFDVVEVELPRAGGDARPVVRHFANVPLFGAHFR